MGWALFVLVMRCSRRSVLEMPECTCAVDTIQQIFAKPFERIDLHERSMAAARLVKVSTFSRLRQVSESRHNAKPILELADADFVFGHVSGLGI